MYQGGREQGDPETGFLDAAGLARTLDAELSRAARHELPLSLVLIEVSTEKAKLPDDDVSRLAEDVAVTIRDRLRGEDHAARLGALRFAVLAVETADSETIAADLAEHVRHALNRSPKNGIALTVSVGAIDCQFDELSRQELMREAEHSLAAAILAGAGVAYPPNAGSRSSVPSRSEQSA